MQDTGKLNDCDGEYWGMDLYVKGGQKAISWAADCDCKVANGYGC